MEHARLEVVAERTQVTGGISRDGESAGHDVGRALCVAGREIREARIEHLRDGGELLHRAVVEQLGEPAPLSLLGEDPLGEKRSLGVVGAQSIIASRSAIATACVRVSASSFARMCRTWLFTVS